MKKKKNEAQIGYSKRLQAKLMNYFMMSFIIMFVQEINPED